MLTAQCSLAVVKPPNSKRQRATTPPARQTAKMKTFKDKEGQSWTLTLSLAKVRKIRESIGLDLLHPVHFQQILGSLTDRLTFAFLLCEPQAKGLDIDADEFEERLYGDGVATEASLAFLAEIEVFTLKLGQPGLAKMAKMAAESMKAGQAKVDEMLKSGQLDSLLEQAEEEIQKLFPKNAGNGSQS